MAQTSSEVRKVNLLALRQRFEVEEFARDPKAVPKGMDKKFGTFIGMSDPKYFGHIKMGRREVGHKVARDAERAFGHPVGWLDRAHPVDSTDEADAVALFVRLYRTNAAAAHRMLIAAANELL